jgi:hypothetical protein
VARMGQKTNAHNILVAISERKNHLENTEVHGTIILRWSLRK